MKRSVGSRRGWIALAIRWFLLPPGRNQWWTTSFRRWPVGAWFTLTVGV